jgi:hypothetical protein
VTWRKWEVVVTFLAETPDSNFESDDMADRLSDSIHTYVGTLPGVDAYSVYIEDAASMPA